MREGADVRLDDWSFRQAENGRYARQCRARISRFDLDAAAGAAAAGRARIQPQGAGSARGELLLQPAAPCSERRSHVGRRKRVTGEAWFDHEWSSDYVDREARGWDWMGINLDDGGALMAFRMRDAKGGARWARRRCVSSAAGSAMCIVRAGDVRVDPGAALEVAANGGDVSHAVARAGR